MQAISKPSYCGMLLIGLKYFAVGTFNPTASEHSVNKTQFVIHVVSWFLMAMSMLGGFIDATSYNDRVLALAVLGNMGLSMSKFTMFSLNRNTLSKFIKLIDVDAVIITKTDFFIKKAIQDIAGSLRNYGVVSVTTGLLYVVSAMSLGQPQSEKVDYKHWEVLHMYMPRDIIVFERFGVGEFIITIMMFYHVYTQVFLDILSVSLLTHLGWQFEALADLFKNVSYSSNHAESRDCLREVINYHQLLLGYAESMQKMFSVVFFIQLVVSCLQLCLCMLLFAHNLKTAEGSLMDAMSHFLLLVLVSFQLFLYTRCADLTKERALLVSEGIYLSEWHLASPSTRRDLISVLMRAQRPISFSAMGIFPITVDTFSQIMRSVYGAFSLITSLD